MGHEETFIFRTAVPASRWFVGYMEPMNDCRQEHRHVLGRNWAGTSSLPYLRWDTCARPRAATLSSVALV
jgi:hypothetical protein